MLRRAKDLTAKVDWRPIAIIHADLEGRVVGPSPAGPYPQRVWIEVGEESRVLATVDGTLEDVGRLAETTRDRLRAIVADSAAVGEGTRDDGPWPFATVVVPTIARDLERLTATVASLRALDYPRYEVIVVDNRTGPTIALALREDERVRVVSESRPGASAARNRGVQSAMGELVAFTDDDAVVDPQWLRSIATRFRSDPDVEGVGGLVLPAEFAHPAQLWFEEFYGGFTRAFTARTLRLHAGHDGDPLFPYGPGAYGAGCNMAFRRSTLSRLGGFDTRLGPGTPARGGEDPELFIRLVSSGGVVAVEPTAIVRHAHRRSDGEFYRQVFGYGVGLTAMYTALVVRDPRHLVSMARRVGPALRHLTRARTERSIVVGSSYPRRTYVYQLAGMLYGPIAYARSVARASARGRG